VLVNLCSGRTLDAALLMYVLQVGLQLGKLVGGLFLGSYGLGIVLNGKGLRCSQYFTGAPSSS
jgi:hypothetical protein